MRLSVGEIWSFLDLQVEIDGNARGLNLNAGGLFLENISIETVKSIQANQEYHGEILEGLFINREILWQPNVYDRVQVCITNLSLFSVFCQEEIERFTVDERSGHELYTHLLEYLSQLGQAAIGKFSKVLDEAEKTKTEDEDSIHDPKNKIPRILGNFRKECFPVIKIFVELLPPSDLARINAQHRMDFAVQIIINQYNLKYSDIKNPYWEVVENPGKPTQPKVKAKPEEASADGTPKVETSVESPDATDNPKVETSPKSQAADDKPEVEPSPENQDA